MPIGSVTRGTTGTNRLRRVDRWIARSPALLRAECPLVVDLGYGASATTTLELHQRLARVRPEVEVLGLEIDPARVASAAASARPGVRFGLGGFEVPSERRPSVIRAFNVLRQYREEEVAEAWDRMTSRLAPGGMLVEGTCDELGRVCSWVDVTAHGARTLTISLRLAGLELPSIVAERLPKALIHRNVPGEGVHRLMLDLDRHWRFAAGHAVYGPSQRFMATARGLVDEGWPVIGTASRWRLGELTVAWHSVAPLE